MQKRQGCTLTLPLAALTLQCDLVASTTGSTCQFAASQPDYDICFNQCLNRVSTPTPSTSAPPTPSTSAPPTPTPPTPPPPTNVPSTNPPSVSCSNCVGDCQVGKCTEVEPTKPTTDRDSCLNWCYDHHLTVCSFSLHWLRRYLIFRSAAEPLVSVRKLAMIAE